VRAVDVNRGGRSYFNSSSVSFRLLLAPVCECVKCPPINRATRQAMYTWPWSNYPQHTHSMLAAACSSKPLVRIVRLVLLSPGHSWAPGRAPQCTALVNTRVACKAVDPQQQLHLLLQGWPIWQQPCWICVEMRHRTLSLQGIPVKADQRGCMPHVPTSLPHNRGLEGLEAYLGQLLLRLRSCNSHKERIITVQLDI